MVQERSLPVRRLAFVSTALGLVVLSAAMAHVLAQGYRERVMMEIRYGRGVNGIQVVPEAHEQVGFGADSWGVDAKGNVYIYDLADDWKIKKFSPRDIPRPRGQILYEATFLDRSGYLICDKAGNVYYHYCGIGPGGGVLKIDTTGQICYRLRLGTAAFGDIVLSEGEKLPDDPFAAMAERCRGQPLIQLFRGDSDDEPEWEVGCRELGLSGPGDEDVALDFNFLSSPTGWEMTIDHGGNLLLTLPLRPIFGESFEGGVPGRSRGRFVHVKITPSGMFGGAVPSGCVNGKGEYYDLYPFWAKAPEAKTYQIPILDASGKKIRSQPLKIPPEIAGETARDAGIGGRHLFVDDAGYIYVFGYNKNVEERMSKCGLDVADRGAIFIFSPSGDLKDKIDFPRSGGTMRAFIDRKGNIYFLSYKDLVVQVVNCRRLAH